ncbi:hypothetical protein ACQF1Z_004449 [Escherichia coli]|nr:hypothetical protein [Escherichia coli]EFH7906535.1 hypothetical protein [Escherichia coli O157:H7]EES1893322.1 hypothetical protein [Escherichia coli]EFE2458535.1 hypothetical protein [Escherichia coli]EFF2612274.1 hypothetical protein [Escherichia coli]
MFMPIISQYVKDKLRACATNIEMMNDPGYAARWLYKRMTGTKLDPRRAMLVKAAFAPKDSLIDMAEAVIRAFKNEDSK